MRRRIDYNEAVAVADAPSSRPNRPAGRQGLTELTAVAAVTAMRSGDLTAEAYAHAGMVAYDGICDPEAGEILFAVMHAELERDHRAHDTRTPAQRRSDAHTNLMRRLPVERRRARSGSPR